MIAPPVIDPSSVTVESPTAGRTVRVFVAAGGIEEQGQATTVRAHNVTTDEWSNPKAYSDTKGVAVYTTGGVGDLIELEADNGETDLETIAYVPESAIDTTCPTVDLPKLTIGIVGGTTFSIQNTTHGANGVDDSQFPVYVTLRKVGSTNTDTATLGIVGDRLRRRIVHDQRRHVQLHVRGLLRQSHEDLFRSRIRRSQPLCRVVRHRIISPIFKHRSNSRVVVPWPRMVFRCSDASSKPERFCIAVDPIHYR